MDKPDYPEVFIGLVAPLGADLGKVEQELIVNFERYGYETEVIKITDIFKFNEDKPLPKSLEYFIKMEICTELREMHGTAILAAYAINEITKKRNNNSENKKKLYIIHQIKNKGEYDLLSNIYDINYIQIACFLNESNQEKILRKKFEKDKDHVKTLDNIREEKINNYLNDSEKFSFCKKKLDEICDKYSSEILKDTTIKLMEKDRLDPSNDGKSGQQIDDIFHESHYFINLDANPSDLKQQTQKFTDLLFGTHDEYPTQDEFGMSLAYSAAVRSNFPHARHIGCSIISPTGEVISVASIRAPTPCANTFKQDEDNIADGFNENKSKIEKWVTNDSLDEDLKKFLKGSLDYHPCTHAEMSAILDAAKQGVSIRGATLYSTTFPCHLCAKDIISGGIEKVVFCEAYPKSKNKELYSKIIEIDPTGSSHEKTSFSTFSGVGPKRYHYVYNLKAKSNEKHEKNIPPLLKFRRRINYEKLEDSIKKCIKGNIPRQFKDLLSKPRNYKES